MQESKLNAFNALLTGQPKGEPPSWASAVLLALDVSLCDHRDRINSDWCGPRTLLSILPSAHLFAAVNLITLKAGAEAGAEQQLDRAG
jgi:hypothetical protein